MTYVSEKPVPTEAQLNEAKELRDSARRARINAEESFQRCDTDGFLSQWASQIGAQKDEANARLLEEAGGYAQFSVLVYNGEVVADKIYEFANKFRPDYWNNPIDYKWRLPNELAEKLGRKWIPEGSKSKVQKALGLHEEQRWFPAKAIITTGHRKSTGLSGAANAYVAVVKREYDDE